MSNWKKNTKQSGGSDIDFEFIAGQVKTGLQIATVSGVVDLGLQEGGYYLDDKGETYFQTEEEVHEFLDFIEADPTLGPHKIDEFDLAEYEEEDEVYMLPFKNVKNKFIFVQKDADDTDNVSYFTTEKRAQVALKKAIGLLNGQLGSASGARKGYIKKDIQKLETHDLEPQADMFRVNCSVKKMADEYELAAFADVTSNRIEYVEGDEDSVRQYRLPLNPPFKGLVKGFRLTTDRATGVFSSKALVDLVKACGLGDIVEEGSKDEDNLDLLAGASFQTTVENTSGSFFRCKGRLPVADGVDIEPLDNPAVVISFDDEPEALAAKIKGFFLQKAYKDKIRNAKNFEGSNMEKAFELLENGTGVPEASTEAEKSNPVGQGQEEETEAPVEAETPTEAPKKATRKPRGRPARKVEPEPEEEVDFSEDLPF